MDGNNEDETMFNESNLGEIEADKEVEKPLRELRIDPNGNIDMSSLDDIDAYIFNNVKLKEDYPDKKHADDWKALPKEIKLQDVAERLGFAIIKTKEVTNNYKGLASPFSRMDFALGEPKYEISPDPKDGEIISFIKKPLDEVNIIKNGQKVDIHYYDVDLSKLPDLDRTIMEKLFSQDKESYVNYFKDSTYMGNFPKYYQMVYAAAAEVARRLGYKPVFKEETLKTE